MPHRHDQFWQTVEKLLQSAPLSFKDSEKYENHQYLTLLDGHPEGERCVDNSSSNLRMSAEKG